MRWGRLLLLVALATASLAVVPALGADPAPFADCAARSATPAIVVGQVACQVVPSAYLGAPTAFSYYVPPACATRRCPTLYLLHGFGGDYHGMLGTAAHPSSWVVSLAKAPPVDPHSVADPWNYADTSTWVPKPSIDLVLVAPDGRTVPGGFGPGPDLDGYWADWNPRYAKGGDHPQYDTPPPRFESYLLDELIPYVEGHLPVGSGRDWRALAGTSLGGFGSYKNGLQHPDVFTSMGSVSGAHNFLFTPNLDPQPATSPVGVQPPVATPYVAPPGPAAIAPLRDIPGAGTFLVATVALGDPAVDQAYFRGNMPRDLAMNGRAFDARGHQSLFVKGFVNDTVPRRPEDATDPVGIAFEDIVFPMNVDMEAAFRDEGVADEFAIHPGLHSEPYRAPWIREQLEAQYARVRHADGGGAPTAPPTTFDYRTIRTDFTIWGWRFHVERSPVEFLTLRAVSCRAITLQGTGKVTFTAPPSCDRVLHGRRTFTVDLGPSMPADEPANAGATPVYGRTVSLDLTAR